MGKTSPALSHVRVGQPRTHVAEEISLLSHIRPEYRKYHDIQDIIFTEFLYSLVFSVFSMDVLSLVEPMPSKITLRSRSEQPVSAITCERSPCL